MSSPYFTPQTQVSSPHLPHLPSPQLTSPPPVSPQLNFFSQNVDLSENHFDWSRADPHEAAYLQQSFSYQSQPPFTPALTPDDQLISPSCNAHSLFDGGAYGQVDSPGLLQDPWGSLGPALPQFESSCLGGWSSVEFGAAPGGDFGQFYQDGYYDNSSSAQPFCSPNTPGPSPHYPQTPTISSPGPQGPPSTPSCRGMTADPGFLNPFDPHHTGQQISQSPTEPFQNQTPLLQTCRTPETTFCPQGPGQDQGSSPQPAGGQVEPPTRKHQENLAKLYASRLLCTVCKREFRSLPALNGHMRSHSSSRATAGINKVDTLKKVDDPPLMKSPSVSMVIPVSVPVQPQVSRSEERCSRLCSPTGGAVLYRSLLQQERGRAGVRGEGDDGGGHYTPPPMLCPVRAGPGLFCSITSRGQQRAKAAQVQHRKGGLSDAVAMETAAHPSAVSQPRINVGRSFQAEVPSVRRRKDAPADSHKALLLWTPMEELERPTNQQRVEALLMMACSSVMPGGGASRETTLQVLSECRGNFLLTVEKLLSAHKAFNNNLTQRCPGACWSSSEKRLFVKSLQLHHKDFRKIQKTVQTKSFSQCVEFYYLWKKKSNVRTPSGLTINLPDKNKIP